MGDARASLGIDPSLPRGGNAPGQLNPVKSEFSTGGINLAAAYCHANRDVSAMATGGHSDHVPVSVEPARNCGWSATDDRESGRESESAHTITNHGVLMRALWAHAARNEGNAPGRRATPTP
jgi:hypothetical protein